MSSTSTRFCFCPRGDTESSRRIFDAIAAGCIPVVSSPGVEVLPFVRYGAHMYIRCYRVFGKVLLDAGHIEIQVV